MLLILPLMEMGSIEVMDIDLPFIIASGTGITQSTPFT